MILTRKTSPTLSTINFTLNDLGSNPGYAALSPVKYHS